MTSSAEHLPREIWLYAFTFLEAHDVVKAFSNLNSFFNSLFHSSHLQLFVRIKANESNEQLPKPIWSHINLENIYAISVGRRKANCLIQFLRWHAHHLTRLHSLSVYLRKSKISTNIQFLIFALDQIPSLKCIRIKYTARSDHGINNLQSLTTSIFNSRFSLRKCSFMFDMSDYNIRTSKWLINPTLNGIYIQSITSNDLFILLSCTPQLHSLYATLKPSKVISCNNTILVCLEKVNLYLEETDFMHLELFKQLTPNLRSFIVKGRFNTADNNYFNEALWHKLLNNIMYFYIRLSVYEITDSRKHNLRNRIRECAGKSWLTFHEMRTVLHVAIKFESTKV